MTALPPEDLFEPYQVEGSAFIAAKKRCVLADDPRLGKSRQVIRALRMLYGHRVPQVLIVAPAGARLDWKREFWRVCPPLASNLATLGQYRSPVAGINLCSYEYATRERKKLERDWDMVVIDEAHYLMNRESGRTKALYGALCADGGIVGRAERVVLLSATLQPKDPSDLWTHMRRLFPELIQTVRGSTADYWKFFFTFCDAWKYYRNPRDAMAGNNRFEWRVTGGKNLGMLQRKLSRVMLRRTIKQVYGDRVVIRCVDLPVSATPPACEMHFSEGQRAAIVEGAEDESYMAWIHDVGLQKVAGVAEYARGRLLDDPNLKLLLFAWHRDVMQAYAAALQDFKVAFLPGGLTDEQRARQRELFNQDHRVCVAQMAAAGEGIDLSAADECILAEPSAVPKTNWQCGNRMVNMKKQGVLVVRFALLQDSLDYRRQQTCLRRMQDIDVVFNQGS